MVHLFVTFLPLFGGCRTGRIFYLPADTAQGATAQKSVSATLLLSSYVYQHHVHRKYSGILVNTLIERVGGVSAENPLESYVGNEGAQQPVSVVSVHGVFGSGHRGVYLQKADHRPSWRIWRGCVIFWFPRLPLRYSTGTSISFFTRSALARCSHFST
jgi:hypothetical protein